MLADIATLEGRVVHEAGCRLRSQKAQETQRSEAGAAERRPKDVDAAALNPCQPGGLPGRDSEAVRLPDEASWQVGVCRTRCNGNLLSPSVESVRFDSDAAAHSAAQGASLRGGHRFKCIAQRAQLHVRQWFAEASTRLPRGDEAVQCCWSVGCIADRSALSQPGAYCNGGIAVSQMGTVQSVCDTKNAGQSPVAGDEHPGISSRRGPEVNPVLCYYVSQARKRIT